MSNIKISDLPASYQAQVLRQLGATSKPTAMSNLIATPKGCKPYKAVSDPKPPKPQGGIKVSKRQMNSGEQQYLRDILHGDGEFEAIAFKLPGGSRYTPDFACWSPEGRLTVHEVKGNYHLHSHGRAVTAFKECAAHFPHVTFVWAAYSKGSFSIQKINEKCS